MTQTIDTVAALVQRIHILQAEQTHGQRLIMAVAGAPGAGKSTIAEQLCSQLNGSEGQGATDACAPLRGSVAQGVTPTDGLARNTESGQRNEATDTAKASAGAAAPMSETECAIVVPMDGFHLDNELLRERGLMSVKGSPQTFDVDGFVALLRRLSVPDGADVFIPVFDRAADLSRNSARCVSASHSVIIVEGNYLLLQRKGWSRLAPLFHLSVMLDVPMQILENRLIQRWVDHGLSPEAARERALSNDIPNAHLVQEESTGAHLHFKSVRQ